MPGNRKPQKGSKKVGEKGAQRRVSTSDQSADDSQSVVSQRRTSKRVTVTELSEDLGEREISEESAAVQDMDAVAETSEMALSEAEGGLDGVDVESRDSSKVDDVVMVTLSHGAQKSLGCVIGENLFVDKTWCQVPKKRILDDLTINKDASPFFPFAKEIEKYNEDEFLIGYTPFEEEQNRFLFCNTVHGKQTILTKLANLREEYMKRIMKSKCIRPGAWESYGSEKEIEVANVQYQRPLLSFEWLTNLSLRNTGQPTFSDMVAGEDKSTVARCLPTKQSLQEMNLIVRKCQDVAVQAVRPTERKCVQTVPQIPTNVAVQCVSQTDITEEAKKRSPAVTNEQLDSFFDKYREYLLKALRYNELYDLYHDDYPALSKLGTPFQAAPIDNYKQYQSFTDVGAIEGKLIVSVSWSPKYTGIFAVAYADEVPCKWKVLESDSDDPDFEEDNADKSDRCEVSKTESKSVRVKGGGDGSGEAQWLDEEQKEIAWKKERREQNNTAFNKAQAKLQQMELARTTQVSAVEEYKKSIRRKEKYSEEWIERKWKREQKLRRKRKIFGLNNKPKRIMKPSLSQGQGGLKTAQVSSVDDGRASGLGNDPHNSSIVRIDGKEQARSSGERYSLKEQRSSENKKKTEVRLSLLNLRKKKEERSKEKKRRARIMERYVRDENAWKGQGQNYNYVFYRSVLTDNLLEGSKPDIGAEQSTRKSSKAMYSATGSQSSTSAIGLRKLRSKELFNPSAEVQRLDDYGVNLSRMKIRREIFQKYKKERKERKTKSSVDGEDVKKKTPAGIQKKGSTDSLKRVRSSTSFEDEKDVKKKIRDSPSLTSIWGAEESWEYGMSLREAIRRLHRHHKRVRKQIHKRIRPMFTPIQWPDTQMYAGVVMKEGISEMSDLRESISACMTSTGSDDTGSASQLRREREKVDFQSRKLLEEYEELMDEEEVNEEAEVLPMLVPNNPVLIWSFEDDLAPKLRLDCPYELSCIQFCPHNGNILAGATASGQVVIWDITGRLEAVDNATNDHTEENKHRKRLEDLMDWTKDVRTRRRVNITAISHKSYSHRERCTDLKWIHPCIEINSKGLGEPVPPGKFSYQFMTTGLCGSILLWDLESPPMPKPKAQRNVKPLEKIFSQLYNAFPESQFAPLNNAWKPFLKIQLPGVEGSPEILTGLAVNLPPCKYARKQLSTQQGPQHMEDRVEYCLVHTQIDNYSNQINIGTRCGDVGIIELKEVDPKTNNLEYVQKWYNLAHDGPVTRIFQHPFFPQLTITSGGHIFAIWHSEFEDYPIMWRRYRKVCVTACLWSALRPSLFRIAREDGTVEIWDLLRQSNRCQRDIIVSGQILTTIAGCRLPLPRGLLGIADYNSTMRMFYIPWQYQVWTEEERLQMETMMNKEPGRLRRMHDWRKWYSETHGSKVTEEEKPDKHDDVQESEDGEIQRQEQIRKKYNEEVYKWYVKRRGKHLTKFEIEAKEKLEARERAHILDTVMTKKKVDRQRMEKLMHPLVKMERLEMERKEKAQRRLKEADALFKAAVQKLFPRSPETNYESVIDEEELSELTEELDDLFGKCSKKLQKEKVDELQQFNWEWDIYEDGFVEYHQGIRELFNTNTLSLRRFKWLKQKLLKQLVEEGHPILVPKTRMELFMEWKYKQREEQLEELKQVYGENYDPNWDRTVTCRRMQDRKYLVTEQRLEDEFQEDMTEDERQLFSLELVVDVPGEKEAEVEKKKAESVIRVTAEEDDQPIKSVLEKMTDMTEEESTDDLDLDEQVLLMTRQSELLPILPSPTGLSWLSLDVQDDQQATEFDYKTELDSTPHTFVSQHTKGVKQQKVVQQSVAINLSTEDESDEEEEMADDETEQGKEQEETWQDKSISDTKEKENEMQMSTEKSESQTMLDRTTRQSSSTTLGVGKQSSADLKDTKDDSETIEEISTKPADEDGHLSQID